jgi:hypothetical protein
MMKIRRIFILLVFILGLSIPAFSQEAVLDKDNKDNETIFDDAMLLDGYTEKYKSLSKDVLVEMIKDDTLNSYRMAAAVRAFKERFSQEVVSREKIIIEKILLRRLNRDSSPFVQVQIMDALCRMDRYRYFESMVPVLIGKLDHYNQAVNDTAFEALQYLLKRGNNRAREARIVFNTIRKTLFLSRKRLRNITEPSPKLKQKLEVLRWSIKVLGTQELKRLPPEVLGLL